MSSNRSRLPPRDLTDRLAGQGFLPAGSVASVLDGGRTNRVWRIGRPDDPGDDLVLKLFRRDGATPLFANDPDREIRSLAALRGTGIVPRLKAHGRFRGETWLLYDHVPGKPCRAAPEDAARLLGRLHRLEAPEGFPPGPNGSAALETQTRAILRRCGAAGPAALAPPFPPGYVEPSPRTCLVHGDPVPANILLAADATVLIDWQCPVAGDPCEDIALFLSPAMQSVYRGCPLTDAETSAFLAAYPDKETLRRYARLRPWFHRRMAAYCLWQSERGAAVYRAGMEAELAALSEPAG